MSENKNEVLAFKGFDENFKCRGFQYEVGKTYIHDGKVKACESGFHSCSNPFDVLNYYDITSRFASVVVSGDLSYHTEDSKVASAEITIKAELKLPELISSCVNYLINFCKKDNNNLASEHSSQLAASGDSSKLAASGTSSKLAASGYSSKLAASGDSSKLAASGTSSIALSAGLNGKVKGGVGCAMALTRWIDSEKRYRITVAYVGENGIKDDTWYRLDDKGEFVEAE